MEHWVSLNVTLNLYVPQSRGICNFSLINGIQTSMTGKQGLEGNEVVLIQTLASIKILWSALECLWTSFYNTHSHTHKKIPVGFKPWFAAGPKLETCVTRLPGTRGTSAITALAAGQDRTEGCHWNVVQIPPHFTVVAFGGLCPCCPGKLHAAEIAKPLPESPITTACMS